MSKTSTHAINVLQAMFDAATELRNNLDAARDSMTDEQFEAFLDGPMGDVVCAAMDVEYILEYAGG